MIRRRDVAALNNDGVHAPARRAPKVAVFVAQAIVNEISDRGYPAGHRLPSEQQMLEEFEVARGTLREALRILEQHGVIRVRSGPGGGPVVMEPDARYLASMLALLMQMHGAPLRSVVEARAVMEPMLARFAAERASDDDLAEIARSVDAMRTSINDLEIFLAANFEFHELIASASGNAVLADLVEALDWMSESKFEVEYSMRTRRAILEAHEQILAALLARDPDRAEAAMGEHVSHIGGYMGTRNPTLMEQGLRWEEVQSWG